MRKFLFNYKEPSSEDVRSMRDFDLVLKKLKCNEIIGTTLGFMVQLVLRLFHPY